MSGRAFWSSTGHPSGRQEAAFYGRRYACRHADNLAMALLTLTGKQSSRYAIKTSNALPKWISADLTVNTVYLAKPAFPWRDMAFRLDPGNSGHAARDADVL